MRRCVHINISLSTGRSKVEESSGVKCQKQSIISLHGVSTVKQWALYHSIASVGGSTADMDGWLKMTVQWWWFHVQCSQSEQSISQRYQSLSLPLAAGRSMAVSWWLCIPGPLFPWLTMTSCFVHVTYLIPGERERRQITELSEITNC